MSNFAQTIIVGYVGKDPDIRAMPSGKAVANFSIAVTERWTDKDGEKQERTEWYNCAAFDRTAEIVEKYVKKGSHLMVTGQQKTDKYEDKEGNTKYSVKTIVRQLVLMPKKGASSEEEEEAPRRSRTAAKARDPEPENFDDDIPF